MELGDRNTSFFNMVRRRNNRNLIRSLTKEDGTVVLERDEVRDETMAYF